MVVNGVKVLKNLGISENSIEPKELAQIDSVEEFAAVFLYWMQNASAAERYVTSKEIFQKAWWGSRILSPYLLLLFCFLFKGWLL